MNEEVLNAGVENGRTTSRTGDLAEMKNSAS